MNYSISILLKKTIIKAILIAIKGLKKIKNALALVLDIIFLKPIIASFTFFYKFVGGRFLMVRSYNIYAKIKKGIGIQTTSVKNKILYSFGNRYLVHLTIIIIAIFVITGNINAKSAKTTNFKDNSIVGQLVDTQILGEETLTEEEIEVSNIKDEKNKYRPSSYIEQRNLTHNPKAPGGETESLKIFSVNNPNSSISSTITQKTPRQRTKIITYEVQDGDTVYDLAARFNITANTIIWENNLNSRGFIKPGQNLKILPQTGITHSIQKGENLGFIAKKYNTEIEKILAANNLSPNSTLQIGQKLILPGGRKIIPMNSIAKTPTKSSLLTRSIITKEITPAVTGSGNFRWPTSCHRITQYYNWRHLGLDVGCGSGKPIYASEDGVVDVSGWGTGYGKYVIINHGGNIKTLYGHFSKLYVQKGQAVNRGDVIGAMGSTGWSTGPHLHFEVRVAGAKKNPLNYIK